MVAFLLVVAAYFCGSLPIGVWVGRWAGVEIRSRGSGNIGATNVARILGRRAGILTLLGDVVKGVVPAALARFWGGDPWLVALIGLAAVYGHLFSIFLRFSGGKGVATAFGVFAVLTPVAAACSALLFAVVAVATRYVSLASLIAASALPVVTSACAYPTSLRVAAALVAVTIIVRHRDNLSRLRRGKEPRFGVRRKTTGS